MYKIPETYIIYGANSDIGSKLAELIVDDVQSLILFYHKNTDNLKNVLSNKKVVLLQSDILNFENLSELFLKVENYNLHRNLGAVYFPAIRSYDFKPLADTSLDIAKDIINVNFLGAINFLKAVLPLNRKVQSTRIAVLGSNVSRTGLKNGSVYSASKAAIANLVKSVSIEEGRYNTLINTVSPGPVETNNEKYSSDYADFRNSYFNKQKELTSLNRLADISDVCSLVRYLTSFDNKHITGEEFFITGGAS